jgi:hypothetical protein
MRGLAVVKTVGLVARAGGAVVDVIAAARTLERHRLRPHPLDWLRAASLDRRLAPYSVTGKYRPPDSER